MTGYALIRAVSAGRWRVRPYALFVIEGWSTDPRGVSAWVAVLAGGLFWLLAFILLYFLLAG